MSEIKPALTVKEWEYLKGQSAFTSTDCRSIFVEGAAERCEFAKAAALCLHDQPFGFTREDVEMIRSWTAGLMSKGYGGKGGPEARKFDDLADRIAAMIPPEETTFG